MKTLPLSLAIAAAMGASLSAQAEQVEQAEQALALDPVTVSADFRNSQVQDLAEAVTVVGEDQIEQRSANHLESVLSYVPNVNSAGSSSRARYYQIRGIGERSQFIDPINPSVGLMIDGIDMTGLGGAAGLFDIEQVEVLRGPQGTRFGANALAGVINIQSKEATKEFEGYAQAELGNYNTHGQQGAISGSITEELQGRLAVSSFQTDGYMENVTLDRSNTNNIDEVYARGKLAAQLNESTEAKLSYFYADIDNGYDAFSLDKNRETLSDQPGTDSQESHAFAFDINSKLSDAISIEAILSTAKSDVEYSYDDDWSYEGIAPGWEYKAFDQYLRDYQRNTFDLRLLSGADGRIFANTTDWVLGIYGMQRSESLTRNYEYIPQQFQSDLDSASSAIYTELTTNLTDTMRLISGLRVENWRNDYSDNNDVKGETDETLVGGKITLETLVSHQHLAYLSLARGYKAGGINTDPDISEENREFDTEFNNAVELGLKSALLNDELTTRIAAFYIQRKNQQVKSSYSYLNNNVPEFQDYLANAAEGKNYGLELETNWNITEQLNWMLSAGYLKTEFVDYSYSNDDGEFNKDGREQAYAPEFSAATSLSYEFIDGLSLTVESEAKDDFYYSDSHDQKAEEYVLWHARIAYQQDDLSLALYGRNLTNQEYNVKGYYFGIDPRPGVEYAKELQEQLGEPRLVGIEARYSF